MFDLPPDQFTLALRELATAVSLVTIGKPDDRSGFVATSVAACSTDPPRLILCVNRESSSWHALERFGRFGLNFVRDCDSAIASRFAGFGGIRGNHRFESTEWITLPTGTQVLETALAAIDCRIEETFNRYDHAIILARVEAIRVCDNGKPLLWFQSRYHHLGEPQKKQL